MLFSDWIILEELLLIHLLTNQHITTSRVYWMVALLHWFSNTQVFVWHFHLQRCCWSFRASGIIVRIIASMGVTVLQLRRTASTCCMGTGGFTTTTSSPPSEQFTRPYERWVCLGVSAKLECTFPYLAPVNSIFIISLLLFPSGYSSMLQVGYGLDTAGFKHCCAVHKINCTSMANFI